MSEKPVVISECTSVTFTMKHMIKTFKPVVIDHVRKAATIVPFFSW